ncbi:hypothetical protein [Flavisphingomonas formosensis]|uniref:hypothetical protein n=1 Tax=Flavisphingomonas formosensis TaxID=861534 RepID=UPI0012FA61DD|nr:hypothetical protein [Sphingomonas formosensis]
MILTPIALALALAACGKPASKDESGPPPVATVVNAGDSPANEASALSGRPDSAVPDATPSAADTAAAADAASAVAAPDTAAASLPEMPAKPDSAQAAATVVETYYALLEQGKYREAWALWGDGGKRSGKTQMQFAAGFASTAETHAEVGAPGDPEGAAGSIFVEVPVTVRATLKDGTAQRFTGSYTLRRVNDVPGSTAEQRRWHIDAAKLKPVPAA